MAANRDTQPVGDQQRNRDAPGLPLRLPVPRPRPAGLCDAPDEQAVASDVLARVRTALLRL